LGDHLGSADSRGRSPDPAVAKMRLLVRTIFERGAVQVITDVDLDIDDGEFVVFVGPSGYLLNCL
jgi:ABC-type transporter Mla maintaining outer membrane lipid asymmetry ATPase subunit MlaF